MQVTGIESVVVAEWAIAEMSKIGYRDLSIDTGVFGAG